jgi:hypothetical protein
MITAFVNETGINLCMDGLSDNLSREQWESLLDELKSQHMPGYYPQGKRSHISLSPTGQTNVVIYFTDETVTKDEAVTILKKWNFPVLDSGENALHAN